MKFNKNYMDADFKNVGNIILYVDSNGALYAKKVDIGITEKALSKETIIHLVGYARVFVEDLDGVLSMITGFDADGNWTMSGGGPSPTPTKATCTLYADASNNLYQTQEEATTPGSTPMTKNDIKAKVLTYVTSIKYLSGEVKMVLGLTAGDNIVLYEKASDITQSPVTVNSKDTLFAMCPSDKNTYIMASVTFTDDGPKNNTPFVVIISKLGNTITCIGGDYNYRTTNVDSSGWSPWLTDVRVIPTMEGITRDSALYFINQYPSHDEIVQATFDASDNPHEDPTCNTWYLDLKVLSNKYMIMTITGYGREYRSFYSENMSGACEWSEWARVDTPDKRYFETEAQTDWDVDSFTEWSEDNVEDYENTIYSVTFDDVQAVETFSPTESENTHYYMEYKVNTDHSVVVEATIISGGTEEYPSGTKLRAVIKNEVVVDDWSPVSIASGLLEIHDPITVSDLNALKSDAESRLDRNAFTIVYDSVKFTSEAPEDTSIFYYVEYIKTTNRTFVRTSHSVESDGKYYNPQYYTRYTGTAWSPWTKVNDPLAQDSDPVMVYTTDFVNYYTDESKTTAITIASICSTVNDRTVLVKSWNATDPTEEAQIKMVVGYNATKTELRFAEEAESGSTKHKVYVDIDTNKFYEDSEMLIEITSSKMKEYYEESGVVVSTEGNDPDDFECADMVGYTETSSGGIIPVIADSENRAIEPLYVYSTDDTNYYLDADHTQSIAVSDICDKLAHRAVFVSTYTTGAVLSETKVKSVIGYTGDKSALTCASEPSDSSDIIFYYSTLSTVSGSGTESSPYKLYLFKNKQDVVANSSVSSMTNIVREYQEIRQHFNSGKIVCINKIDVGSGSIRTFDGTRHILADSISSSSKKYTFWMCVNGTPKCFELKTSA